MGKYWFMVLLFLGVTAIGCQGDHTGEDSRAGSLTLLFLSL